MSTKTREVASEEFFVCDICEGKIQDEPFVPEPWSYTYDRPDFCFHKECWDNVAEWVHKCPRALFSALFSGDPSYGKLVEAVRNHKYLLFIEAEEPYVLICDDKQHLDNAAAVTDSTEKHIFCVIVNGKVHEAYLQITVHLDED